METSEGSQVLVKGNSCIHVSQRLKMSPGELWTSQFHLDLGENHEASYLESYSGEIFIEVNTLL